MFKFEKNPEAKPEVLITISAKVKKIDVIRLIILLPFVREK
ncbi:MAG: hypothetical protein OFPII_17080 [Osedax symbiont Rs1]|nr:MAG: hypothetical protein OFPII_17080 [Osedax symbiont Rs1]